MRPFPLCRFTIETTLAPHQVQARLRNAIAVKWTFGFSESDRPFVGQFDGTSFDIARADGQRSSFCPRIHGSIQPRASGTRLSGTLQLHKAALVAMLCLLILVGTAFLSGAAWGATGGWLEPLMIGGLGVLVFLAAMTLGGFFSDLNRSIDELAELVDASIADVR
jgi:hypothetical protein